jgi:hypothetical protein
MDAEAEEAATLILVDVDATTTTEVALTQQNPRPATQVLVAVDDDDDDTNFIPSAEEMNYQDALVKYMVKNYVPLRLVDDADFQNFVRILNPRANIPKQHTIQSRSDSRQVCGL